MIGPIIKNSGLFYEKTKSKAIPDILTDGISEYTCTAAKTDLINKYFKSVFNKGNSPTHLNVEIRSILTRLIKLMF